MTLSRNKMVRQALRNNLNWFRNSGVMVPDDGSWGVAERVIVTDGNSCVDKIYKSFPAWTEKKGYSIIEPRRADCNFETALMFLLAEEACPGEGLRSVAENILDFLYFRSGLLNRYDDKLPIAAWNWSHIKWNPYLWFDDNGWCVVIQFLIAAKYPELDRKYDITHWARQGADSLLAGFERSFSPKADGLSGDMRDPDGVWFGNLLLPHWGAPVVMALALGAKDNGDDRFIAAVRCYFDYLWKEREGFIVSEDAYALIGAAFVAEQLEDSTCRDIAAFFADKILTKMNPETGNIPAEHREAPLGEHLADLIYTVNWALLGMEMMARADNSAKRYQVAFEKLLDLVLHIQDKSTEPQFAGCWRGMYDLTANSWGGGDCYEGGAGSIYTGWTNAPISWVLARFRYPCQ